MSTEIKCDGCGAKLDTRQRPNWWHAVLMGDTIRNSNGVLIENTGLVDRSTANQIIPIDNADLCIPCMSKTQGGTT